VTLVVGAGDDEWRALCVVCVVDTVIDVDVDVDDAVVAIGGVAC
jgi:hypothetical protein